MKKPEKKPATIRSLQKKIAEQEKRLEEYRVICSNHDQKIREWRTANDSLDKARNEAVSAMNAALKELRVTLGAFCEYALALSNPATAQDTVRLAELQRQIAQCRVVQQDDPFGHFATHR